VPAITRRMLALMRDLMLTARAIVLVVSVPAVRDRRAAIGPGS
jgi:hypothetical protein